MYSGSTSVLPELAMMVSSERISDICTNVESICSLEELFVSFSAGPHFDDGDDK